VKISELPILESVKEKITKSGIEKLYPPQIEAIKAGVLKGKNLVLASPTASGKTLIAEICALKHILENKGKILYLTPLRALASEKFEEFKKYTSIKKLNGRRIRVGISTGDFDSSDSWLERYDIIVTTNEKADSLLRHRAEWMEEISLIVSDEVHLLNDAERGPTLEVVLARLMQINPYLQILLLSATINNINEVADWIKAGFVTTEWRPIPLKEGVFLHNEIQYRDGFARKIKNNSRINLAYNMIKSGGQTLTFASTRRKAVKLAQIASGEVEKLLTKSLKRALEIDAKKILSTGEKTRISDMLAETVMHGTAFHHAGLGAGHRRIIEESFKKRKIKFLAATPTLAFGVNLPARMVIINDYRRYIAGYGYYPISVLEYKQMSGRAGRPKYDKMGEAILIAKTADEAEFLMENYVLSSPERIWSKLAVERILRSHVLATIAAEFEHTEIGIYDFFSKTFYAYQYEIEAIKNLLMKILKYLYQEEMIDISGQNIYATKFGKRVSDLYIDPVSGIIIRDASMKRRPFSELSILHIIAHTPDMNPKLRPYTKEVGEISAFVEEHKEEFLIDVPNEWDDITYEEFLGEVKIAMVLKAWIEEVSEDEIIGRFRIQPGDLYRTVENAKWLLYAIYELALLFGNKQIPSRALELRKRVEKGIKRELLPLTRLKGVGRIRGRKLYDSGLTTLKDVRSAPIDRLINLPFIGTKLARTIKEQVGGFVKKEEWNKFQKNKERQQKALTEF
jgi:helicase